ncbi:MAG: NAD(+) synthase [Spirochaetaceae bacterium]|nr:NAD(+) synthase [Spirochaetaceae bacterium]
MEFGFFRIACCSPEVTVAGCKFNEKQIIESVKKADSLGVNLLVMNELCVTGYTCADLFFQDTLLENAKNSIVNIAESTKKTSVLFAVGCPIQYENSLYNCAVWIFAGKILAIIPKTNISSSFEKNETRYFVSGKNLPNNSFIQIENYSEKIPLGTDILISHLDTKIGTEISDDLFAVQNPSSELALNGALIIANLSASNEIVGRANSRKIQVQSQSEKLCCAYLYANANKGESTTNLIFSGHNLIAENGKLLAESELFSDELIIADIDIELLKNQRKKMNSSFQIGKKDFRIIEIEKSAKKKKSLFSVAKLYREISPYPFIPSDKTDLDIRCKEIVAMLSHALAKRLKHTRTTSAVLGLSGGLDSTLALLLTYEAFKLCNLDYEDIIAITMPCFGTTDRTYKNACNMAKSMGVTLKEISIEKAVRQHFEDIGQDENNHDVTYENSQARERTQILMDVANQCSGLVIGTGDMSELALGWATYNGDHMSMYGVNSSVPKTLVRHLVSWFSEQVKGPLSDVLKDILETPVSPELLPPKDGVISQCTEELVGPYDLHDFFLYYFVRWGFTKEKIKFLAHQAFDIQQREKGKPTLFSKDKIDKWIEVFYRRFYSQQFKRSCLPDGVKIGSVGLSPRGDLLMPSDAVLE